MQSTYEKLKHALARDQRPKTSFRAWLLDQVNRDDPTGDLAREFLHDRVDNPERIPKTDQQLARYFKATVVYEDGRRKMPAPEEVVDEAWAEWLHSRT